jgi:hypothetical protein
MVMCSCDRDIDIVTKIEFEFEPTVDGCSLAEISGEAIIKGWPGCWEDYDIWDVRLVAVDRRMGNQITLVSIDGGPFMDIVRGHLMSPAKRAAIDVEIQDQNSHLLACASCDGDHNAEHRLRSWELI